MLCTSPVCLAITSPKTTGESTTPLHWSTFVARYHRWGISFPESSDGRWSLELARLQFALPTGDVWRKCVCGKSNISVATCYQVTHICAGYHFFPFLLGRWVHHSIVDSFLHSSRPSFPLLTLTIAFDSTAATHTFLQHITHTGSFFHFSEAIISLPSPLSTLLWRCNCHFEVCALVFQTILRPAQAPS